jgi:hypothetical protein
MHCVIETKNERQPNSVQSPLSVSDALRSAFQGSVRRKNNVPFGGELVTELLTMVPV